MDLKQQILDTPRALRETMEKGKPEFEEIIRRVRWGDGPIFLVGAGASYIAGLTGALGIESLLGWPVVVRPSAAFEAYGASVLRPRSIVMAISNSGTRPETISAARAARARGAVVLAFSNNSASELAQTADLAFQTRAGAPGETGFQTVLCQQAALGFLSLLAARILKRHHHQLEILDEEFLRLPGQIESIQVHMSDAVSALAREIYALRSLSILGSGFYYPIALQAARMFRQHAHAGTEGIDGALNDADDLVPMSEGAGVLILSGSHDRLKKRTHTSALQLKNSGVKVLAVTDANDRELAQAADLTVLIPSLSEMVGAIFTLAMLQSAAAHGTRIAARDRTARTAAPARREGSS